MSSHRSVMPDPQLSKGALELKTLLKGIVIVAVGSAVLGCGGNSAGIVGQQEPRVRLFDAVDGQTSVTATYQDSTLKNLGTSTSAAYGSTSNDTIITNTNATATIDSPNGPLFTTPSQLYRIGDYYTIYTGGSATNGYKSLALQDTQSVAPNGTVGLRVVHVGVNTPSVDVYFQPALVPQSTSTPLFSGLTYATLTGPTNATVAVDENGYALPQVPTNAYYSVYVNNHGSATAIASVASSFQQGNYYTVVVYDTPGGGTSVTVETDHRTD